MAGILLVKTPVASAVVDAFISGPSSEDNLVNSVEYMHASPPTVIETIPDIGVAGTCEMYGAEFAAFGRFYDVDVSDGSVSAIGNTDDFLASMDFSPSGVLYAASDSLKEVDPATGLTSNRRSINFVGGPEDDILTGLTFSPSGELFGIGNGNGNLWEIDPVTADAEFAGSSGISIFSLEFGPDGTLYGAGFDLWEISTYDGSATMVGRIADGDLLVALDFAPNGVMYGASSNITADALYTIDLKTGEGNLIGVTHGNLVALASVPEPGTVLLVGLGGLMLRRRRGS